MEELRERIEAVERAVTEGESDLTALAEGAAQAERVDALAADVETLQEDVTELRTATQALRGYVGNIRSVNESVEERADGALAVAESLEDRVEALEDAPTQSSNPEPVGVGDRSTVSSDDARANRRRDQGNADGICQSCGRPDPYGPTETDPTGEAGVGTSPIGERRESGRSSAGGSLDSRRRVDRTDGQPERTEDRKDRIDRTEPSSVPNRSPAPDRTDRWEDGEEASLLGSIRDRL